MPLRKPEEGETQSEFMSYCMRELKDSDTERSQEQMVAICLRAWRGDKAEKFVSIVSGLRTRLILDNWQKRRHWEDQPRVPAGSPEGGQFGAIANGFRVYRDEQGSLHIDQIINSIVSRGLQPKEGDDKLILGYYDENWNLIVIDQGSSAVAGSRTDEE